MASTAFACTHYHGTMTVQGSAGGTSTAVAWGPSGGMEFCSDPRLLQHGGTASDVAQLQGPLTGGDATGTVVISTTEGTCNGRTSQLRAGDYRVSWNSDFSLDCMTQAGGVPQYIDPKPLTVNTSGDSTGTVADRTYTIPALATGLFDYAGVCITHSAPTAGVPEGNKAPVLIVGGWQPLTDGGLARRAKEECDALQQGVDWPSEVPKGDYVRTSPGVPSIRKKGAASFEVEYEGGFCHVVIDSDGTVVHPAHYRKWTEVDGRRQEETAP